jgi:NAD(P)H-hydrate epimerase
MNRIAIPAVTRPELEEMRRELETTYFIDLLQSMENAGHNLAMLARLMLEDDILDRAIVVLAGRGKTGGVGLVGARHLRNWGADVQIVCMHPSQEFHGAPARQLQSLIADGAPLAWAEEGWELPPCDLIIDSIIGDGLDGAPRAGARNLIQLANSSTAPILSVEAPSGFDVDRGEMLDPCVKATATLMLAAPSTGMATPAGREAGGELYLADIGVPNDLYSEIFLYEASYFFAQSPLMRLHATQDPHTSFESDRPQFWIEP